MEINIKGKMWTIRQDDLNNPLLADNDGITMGYKREIIIRETKYLAETLDEAKERYRHVLRHELVHAFSFECGLYDDERLNEGIVDWIASVLEEVEETAQLIEVD